MKVNALERTELLVDAIIQGESAGDPMRVGSSGERGLMQIMSGTWKDVTRDMFGRPINFDRAFQPEWNRRVGRGYLAHIHATLQPHKEKWMSDERSLVIAAYNGGLGRLEKGGYNLDHMPASTKDYVARVTALHDLYVAQREGTNEEWAQRPAPAGDTAQVADRLTLGS